MTTIKRCECGRIYELRKIKVPVRDKDSIHCECGRELMAWNGGVMYIDKKIGENGELFMK